MYSKSTTNSLQVFYCFSNAAFADNPDCKSSYRYLFQLYNGLIAWKATKQLTITTFSTKAKLLALIVAVKEALWWQRLFKALEFNLNENLQIDCDNLQTVRLLANNSPLLPTKLRHVDIH